MEFRIRAWGVAAVFLAVVVVGGGAGAGGCAGWPYRGDGPRPPDPPPAPRLGLLLGVGAGLDGVTGLRSNPRRAVVYDRLDMMLALHLRLGAAVTGRFALVGDLQFGLPLVSFDGSLDEGEGTVLATAGASALFFHGDTGWHLIAGGRYGAVGRFPTAGLPARSGDATIWLGELGIGHATRRDHVDRTWSVALIGGPMPTSPGSWLVGVSFTGTITVSSTGD